MVSAVSISSGAVGPGEMFFDIKLVWLNSKEAACYLRKTVGALRTAVCRGYVRARKWKRRLYFRREDLDALLNNSQKLGGF
jgi:hypothetical protein